MAWRHKSIMTLRRSIEFRLAASHDGSVSPHLATEATLRRGFFAAHVPPGLLRSPMKESRDQGALDAPIPSQSTNQTRRGIATVRVDHFSLQTSYRFDNCHCAGRAKDSDEQEVALSRRKTTTKRSQRRERGQLPHPWVHPECFHLALDVAPLGVVTQTASIQATQRNKK